MHKVSLVYSPAIWNILKIYFLYTSVSPACVYMHHVHEVHVKTRRGDRYPETSYSQLFPAKLGLNPAPCQKDQVLLTAKPSLQHHHLPTILFTQLYVLFSVTKWLFLILRIPSESYQRIINCKIAGQPYMNSFGNNSI